MITRSDEKLLERFPKVTNSSHFLIHFLSDNILTDRCSQPDARHNFRNAGCSPVENFVIYVEYEEELIAPVARQDCCIIYHNSFL
jgi:hypothetical protein